MLPLGGAPALASPGTIYVSPAGNDTTGNGSSGNPYKTIQKGIDIASSGSTVQVTAGTYFERITLKSGVAVLGAGASVTTINGTASGTVVTAISVTGAKLDGFTIANGNSATVGGGMYNESSSPTVTNCTFYGNSAGNSGGGMFNNSYSSPTMTNCTFYGNSADAGGGMYNYSNSSPTVTNCTFYGNSASNGGGMFNNISSSPMLTNCTFYGNSVAYNGSGMRNSNSSSPTLTNSILWDGGGEISNASSNPVVTYCDILGGYSGTGNINADPLFVNPSAHDFHLKSTSPCIDAGDNSTMPFWLTTDFEGNPRIVDGNDNGVAVVDIGADEYMPVVLGDANSDGNINVSDMIMVARIILELDLSNPAADVNHDGFISVLDITKIARIILGLD